MYTYPKPKRSVVFNIDFKVVYKQIFYEAKSKIFSITDPREILIYLFHLQILSLKLQNAASAIRYKY